MKKTYQGCLLLLLFTLSTSIFANRDFSLTTQYHRAKHVVESWLGQATDQNQLTDNDSPSQHSLDVYPAKTALSKKAITLKMGMSKDQVRALLGNPTWAESSPGEPLAWSWRNDPCSPVVVTFDKNMKVKGYDQGRSECVAQTYKGVPGDAYLCSKNEQKLPCQ